MPITSRNNPLIKHIRRLGRRKYRLQEGVYFVEGLRPIVTALDAAAPVEHLIYAADLLTSQFAWERVEKAVASGVPATAVSGELFRSISSRDNPAGLGAIIAAHPTHLSSLPLSETSLYVTLYQTADPGNVGAILRTLDAVRSDGLILLGSTTDPFQSSVARASMGSLFTVPIAIVSEWNDLASWGREQSLAFVATSAGAAEDYRSVAYSLPMLLMMGSERQGLPLEVQRACQSTVRLPMMGSASSLNLAVATGVMLYQIRYGVYSP